MDKLSWFKFSPSDWAYGKIQRCSNEAKTEFITLCCIYWNKECFLSIEDARDSIDTYDELLKRKVITELNTCVQIQFLNNQLDGIEVTREKRRDAGRKGGQASAKQKQASAKQVLEVAQANPTREEESRVEKKREEDINTHTPFLEYNSKDLTSNTTTKVIGALDWKNGIALDGEHNSWRFLHRQVKGTHSHATLPDLQNKCTLFAESESQGEPKTSFEWNKHFVAWCKYQKFNQPKESSLPSATKSDWKK